MPDEEKSGKDRPEKPEIDSHLKEEKIDKSLDEVSNVIHDLLSEPDHPDTDEQVERVLSGNTGAPPEPKPKGLSRLGGLFKRRRSDEGPPEPAEELPEPADVVPGEDGSAGNLPEKVLKSILEPVDVYPKDGGKYAFDEFVDERILVSRDAFGKKEMKIKVLEVSDEKAPTQWKLGDRVKIDKILITIKHLESQEIEEGEFDIKAIEEELIEKRHYTSTNRWVPVDEIKNGYVSGARHTTLVSDAAALDYIAF
ncbi:hypothetical protein CENSYa_0580 [Cenarchaeum symbiosum A]|uniref:Uncharacterized protein n=1 Tax=Cenarchaeum symbiosum (strain A) TaxID=414004 RepID=A0RV46_CENSY|nr:hypothetical protein CENSYa_0580 [Cenarchaeum symbiosum A]